MCTLHNYSYRGMPVVARMCVYTASNVITKKYWNKNKKLLFFNEQKVGMLLQKRTDTRVGISSMRKSIYIPP